MKKAFALVLALSLIMLIGSCLAEEVEITPGSDRENAPTITPGSIVYSKAANQLLWYTFEATDTGEWVLTLTDLSLRWNPGSSSRDFLPVPVMITDKYERVFADMEIQIPNDHDFHATYPQDGQKTTLMFNVTEGTTYYVLINVSAYDLPENPGPVKGFFNLSLCSQGSHIPAPEKMILQEEGCETPEISASICALCGTVLSSEEHAASGHDFGDEQELEPATCQHTGVVGRICSKCGKQEQTGELPMLAHKPGPVKVFSVPTCTTDGYAEQRCEVCNEIIKQETTPAFGHTPKEVKVISSPTCETEGRSEQRCETCNALIDEQILPALGHQPGEMVVVEEPTCVNDGYNEQRCKVCNACLNSEIIPAMGHHKGPFHTVREADAEMPGEEAAICLTCGQVLESRNIPALGGYTLAFSASPRYQSKEKVDLTTLNILDMTEMDGNENEYVSTLITNDTITVQESAESKLFNACYVPFCVELSVPAYTSVDAEYVFDISSIKQASGGSAIQTIKLMDLGDDPSIDGICIDASSLQDQAMIAFTIGKAKETVEENGRIRVSYTNTQDQQIIVKRYFGLFSSINYAAQYEHIMSTKCLVTVQAEWSKVSSD